MDSDGHTHSPLSTPPSHDPDSSSAVPLDVQPGPTQTQLEQPFQRDNNQGSFIQHPHHHYTNPSIPPDNRYSHHDPVLQFQPSTQPGPEPIQNSQFTFPDPGNHASREVMSNMTTQQQQRLDGTRVDRLSSHTMVIPPSRGRPGLPSRAVGLLASPQPAPHHMFNHPVEDPCGILSPNTFHSAGHGTQYAHNGLVSPSADIPTARVPSDYPTHRHYQHASTPEPFEMPFAVVASRDNQAQPSAFHARPASVSSIPMSNNPSWVHHPTLGTALNNQSRFHHNLIVRELPRSPSRAVSEPDVLPAGGAPPSAPGPGPGSGNSNFGSRATKKRKKSKMHKCDICAKQFPRPSGLQTHMNTHNGLKPFHCSYQGCSRAFAVRSNAKRHLRTHGIAASGSIRAQSPTFNVDFSAPTTIVQDEHFKPPVTLRWMPQSLTTRKNARKLRSLSESGSEDDSEEVPRAHSTPCDPSDPSSESS